MERAGGEVGWRVEGSEGVPALQVSVSHEMLLFEASEVSLDLGDVLWP